MEEFFKVFFLLVLYTALASVLALVPYAIITVIFFDFFPGLIIIFPLLAAIGPLFSLPSLLLGAGVCILSEKKSKITALSLVVINAVVVGIGNSITFYLLKIPSFYFHSSQSILFVIVGAMTGYFLWRWYYKPKAVP